MTLQRQLRGNAGYVSSRRNQITGNFCTVYNAKAAQIDAGAKWATVCEEHGTVMGSHTQALARAALDAPADWCEGCQLRVKGIRAVTHVRGGRACDRKPKRARPDTKGRRPAKHSGQAVGTDWHPRVYGGVRA